MDHAQPPTGTGRRSAIDQGPLALAGLGMLVLLLGLWAWQHRLAAARDAGAALFHGQAGVALTGVLPGHSEPLPVLASRCSNCHEAGAAVPALAAIAGLAPTPAAAVSPSLPQARPVPPAGAPSVAPSTYASRLDRETLTQARRRRGGPPSRYDAVALCGLLRGGVDPAHIVVADEMPRYAASDAQCAQLWAYLAGPGSR